MPMKHIALIITCAILCSACQQKMYFPDRVNSPGFREGGEAKLNLSLKMVNYDDSIAKRNIERINPAVEVAYAVTDHIGIIGSWTTTQNLFIKEDTSTDRSYSYWDRYYRNVFGGNFNGQRFDIGAGYFTTFDSRGLFELYAGYGNGSMQRVSLLTPHNNYTARYHRYFAQWGLGFSTNNVSFMSGFRMAVNRFYEFNGATDDLQYRILRTPVGADSRSVTDANFTLIEPYINFEGGYRFVKINVQVGGSGNLSANSVSGDFPMYIHIGLTFRYAPRYFPLGPFLPPRGKRHAE